MDVRICHLFRHEKAAKGQHEILWIFVLRVCPRCWLQPAPQGERGSRTDRNCASQGGCLEEVASTQSTARAKQLSSPMVWPGPSSPLSLCTQPGLSQRERRRLGQRGGVLFPWRRLNSNIWFCCGSHGLFTKEIKAYLFLAQDRFLWLCRQSMDELSDHHIHCNHTKTSTHPSSSPLGKQSLSHQTDFPY